MIISHHERVVDSLPAPEVKDTIAVVLQDAAGPGDQRPHRHLRPGVERRDAPAVQQTSWLTRRYTALSWISEAEDTAFLMNRFEQTEAIRRRSSYDAGRDRRRGRGAHAAVRRHPVARHQPQQPLPAGAGAGQPRQRSAAGGAREADAGHHARHQRRRWVR